MITWSHQVWNINRLRPHPKNPRVINDGGVKELGESIDSIGLAQPININTDGTILSGHARVQAEKKRGALNVPVYVPNRPLTEDEQKEILVRMNKNIAGEWDMDALKADFIIDSLVDWGFSQEELQLGDMTDTEIELPKDETPKENKLITCPHCNQQFSNN